MGNVGSYQKVGGTVDALQIFAGNVHRSLDARARSQEDGVIDGLQVVDT